MELDWKTSQPIKHASGQFSIEVPSGKTLKIETTPNGEELLSEQCPSGCIWTVHISIFAEESAE